LLSVKSCNPKFKVISDKFSIFKRQFTINFQLKQFTMKQNSNNYDLAKRTAKFGEDTIMLCKSAKSDNISKPILNQLVRSGTSIGANYCEANNASSKKDFRNKIFICKKESQETKYWLQMLAKCHPEKKEEIRRLWKECQELTMIFQKIINTLKEKTCLLYTSPSPRDRTRSRMPSSA